MKTKGIKNVKPVTIALSDRLAKQTRVEAAKLNLSRSKWIAGIIEDYLKRGKTND